MFAQRAGARPADAHVCCGGRKGLFAPRLTRRQDVRDEQQIHRAHRPPHAAVARWLVGALAVAVALALPWLVPSGLLSSLVITGILFIAVLGLDVLMGYAGQVSLGQSGFMAIGGYTAAILAHHVRLAAVARHRSGNGSCP